MKPSTRPPGSSFSGSWARPTCITEIHPKSRAHVQAAPGFLSASSAQPRAITLSVSDQGRSIRAAARPQPQLGLSFEEPRDPRRIWPVRELVGQVRELVEQEYGDVWVEGEISNYRPAPSGHVYFTLKDADAQLPVVLFRRQAMLLRFRPEDGLHVLVRGRVSVYEQRGQMQLVAETMEPVGAGSLQLAFEQLKERLKAEGLFDAERKRPLPAFPRTVGIVTSPTGAVIRDFLNIVAPPPLRPERAALPGLACREIPRRRRLKLRSPS